MRDAKIDMMRVLGTMLVILAHVSAPRLIIGIRSFDVCALVMISGASYLMSSNNGKSYPQYVISRIKRLCIPAYITASFIFLLCALLCAAVGREYPYSVRQIIETFLFIGGKSGGIGYFWIVRVYLLIALVSPLLRSIDSKIRSNTVLSCMILLLFACNELIFLLFFGKNGDVIDLLLENYVMSVIAYSVITLIGMRLKSNAQFGRFFFPIAIALMAISWYVHRSGYLSVVRECKYPPRFTYLIYGICISMLIGLVLERTKLGKINSKWISWLSKNSYNIYLAHIVLLFIISWADKVIGSLPIMQFWLTKYILIVVGAIAIAVSLDLLSRLLNQKGGITT